MRSAVRLGGAPVGAAGPAGAPAQALRPATTSATTARPAARRRSGMAGHLVVGQLEPAGGEPGVGGRRYLPAARQVHAVDQDVGVGELVGPEEPAVVDA